MIALITAMYGRPEISRIFCEGIERLRNETGLRINVFAAISEQESLKVCNDYKITPVFAENNPLGAKWNAVFNEAMKCNPDGILIMGSDDFISSEYLKAAIQSEQYATGLNSLYFVDSKGLESLSFRYYDNKTIGAGRYIPRAVLDKLKTCTVIKRNEVMLSVNPLERELICRDGTGFSISENDYFAPYEPHLNSSLDYSLELFLARNWERFHIHHSDKIHCLDLKSKINIWGFDKFRNMIGAKPDNFENASWFLSQLEIDLIKSLGKQ